MFNSIEEIFLSKSRKQSVKGAHDSMKEIFPKELSLLEHYAVGHSWSPEKVGRVDLEPITYHMLHLDSVPDPQFKQFGVFNKIECSYMYRRADFLATVPQHDLSKPVSRSLLNRLSVEASRFSPQCLYPIKTYLVAQGWEDEMWDGILPNTGPVNDAIAMLFGKSLDSYSASLLCRDLANELKQQVSPLYVNSALWVMGRG